MIKPPAITEVVRLRAAFEGRDRLASGVHLPADVAAEIRWEFHLIGFRPRRRADDHLRARGVVYRCAGDPLRGVSRAVQDSSA